MPHEVSVNKWCFGLNFKGKSKNLAGIDLDFDLKSSKAKKLWLISYSCTQSLGKMKAKGTNLHKISLKWIKKNMGYTLENLCVRE